VLNGLANDIRKNHRSNRGNRKHLRCAKDQQYVIQQQQQQANWNWQLVTVLSEWAVIILIL
jgi:hypothetical protein